MIPPLVVIIVLGSFSSQCNTYLTTQTPKKVDNSESLISVTQEACDELKSSAKSDDNQNDEKNRPKNLVHTEGAKITAEGDETKIYNERREEDNQIQLKNAQAVDRDLQGVTVDVTYNLNVPSNWYNSFETTSPSYNETMLKLHGHDIWDLEDTLIHDSIDSSEASTEPSLSSFLDFLQLTKSSNKLIGSPLEFSVLKELFSEIKPKIFLEVGVYQGMTSTWVAKYFKAHDEFKDSYVLSMDTWLLDLRFTWNGLKSQNVKETQTSTYFTGTSKTQGGYSTMYYHFLMNCIKSDTTDRIIPIPTASQNGAMALLSHGIRPDIIYVDASHSNPDVLIDYENFYTILRPGGVIAFDDTGVPAVRAALDALVKKYKLDIHEIHKQAWIYKMKEKYE